MLHLLGEYACWPNRAGLILASGYDVHRGKKSGMYRRICTILCCLSTAILLMPQGWCCWLPPMQCCEVVSQQSCCKAAPKAEPTCCHCQKESSPEEDQPATPLPQKCAKCLHDTIKPTPTDHIDSAPLLSYLLPMDTMGRIVGWNGISQETRPGASPPLHVQLCVWLC